MTDRSLTYRGRRPAPLMLLPRHTTLPRRPTPLRRTVLFFKISALVAITVGCGAGQVDSIVLGPELAQRAMGTYDTNRDNSLSQDELKKSSPLLASLPRIDANKDAAISLEEFSSRVKTLSTGARYIALDVRIVDKGKPVVGAELTLVPEVFMGEGGPKFSGTSSVGGYCSIKSDGPRLPGVPVGWYVATIVVADSQKTVTKGIEIASDTTGNRLEISL